MKTSVIFDLVILLEIIYFEVFADKITAKNEEGENQKREKIILQNFNHRESDSLLGLLRYVGEMHLQDCSTSIILYDDMFEKSHPVLLKELFKKVPFTYVKKRLSADFTTLNDSKTFLNQLEEQNCWNYIIFIENLKNLRHVLDRQSVRKVVAISGASSWTVFDFLKSPIARLYANLLVVARSTSRNAKEGSFLLYTHKLYSDGIGSSSPVILTSWIKDGLTKPGTVLFPRKLKDGFNGHRFRVAATHKPPFAIRRVLPGTDEVRWDGIDIRLITLLSKVLNFTVDVRVPSVGSAGPLKAVTRELSSGKASVALGGLYRTVDLMTRFDTTFPHTYDCASFISLGSTALPRYRAVLGPFRPWVWVTLMFAYLGAIIPLTLSSKNSLLSLITRPKELIEMFWFVFSNFTNCFTIRSPLVYEGLAQNATGILISLYWVFTIIITSCYTSSIIAFITIPVYPTAMDSSNQLLYYRYRIGTLVGSAVFTRRYTDKEIDTAVCLVAYHDVESLSVSQKGQNSRYLRRVSPFNLQNARHEDHDGWESFFDETDDPRILKLFKKMEFVPSVEEGIRNASRAYFWPYAFLGSKAMLEYIIQADFTPSWKTKRSLMHISRECFVQFGVTIAFPKDSVHTQALSKLSQRAYQAGLIQKITSDVRWDVQRSATGKLLQVSSEGTLHIPSAEERQLTLDDIQGMFMVLGAGILIALLALVLECATRRISKCCSDVQDSEDSSETRSGRRLSSCDSTYRNYFDEYETSNVLTRHFRSSI